MKIYGFVDSNWDEVRKELFTPEEIAASDLRVALIGELIESRTYAEYVKEHIVTVLPAEKTGGHWRNGDKGYAHICKRLEDNFLNLPVPEMCSIKGSRISGTIKYHRDAASLNSSQVMCINFFCKFFEKEKYEVILLNSLRRSGLPLELDVRICDAIFEYEPDAKEGTNFDFYLMLSNGKNISFEIKYTEAKFGGLSRSINDPEKYKRKWEETYRQLVANCPYLETACECYNGYRCILRGNLSPEACANTHQCGIYCFYQHYQISRNIARIEKTGDIAVFLTPEGNRGLDEGRAYIDSFQSPYIVNLYWENLLDILEQEIKDDPDLKQYYRKFCDKYFDFKPL